MESNTDLPFRPQNIAADKQHEWLMTGGEEKAKSVIQLTRGLKISSVLDIGSGTGAVLNYLEQLDFADDYYALEPSEAELAYMLKNARPSRLREAEAETLENSSFARRHFDLAILSHVLEHVDAPASLLSNAMATAEHLIVEVPLDGTKSSNLRAWVKRTMTGIPRHNNSAGHIQFFSMDKLDALVHFCGGQVVGRRLYLPDYHPGDVSSPKRAYFRAVDTAARIVGHDRWARLYHGHYAILIRHRQEIPSSERTRWANFYFYGEPSTSVDS